MRVLITGGGPGRARRAAAGSPAGKADAALAPFGISVQGHPRRRGPHPAALEYQVRQTSLGIDIAVAASGPLDHPALVAALVHGLRAAACPTRRCTSGRSPTSPGTPSPAGPPVHRPGHMAAGAEKEGAGDD